MNCHKDKFFNLTDKITSSIVPNFLKILPFQPYFILQLIFDNMPATYTRGRLIFSLLEIIVRPLLEGDLYQRATYTRINTVLIYMSVQFILANKPPLCEASMKRYDRLKILPKFWLSPGFCVNRPS